MKRRERINFKAMAVNTMLGFAVSIFLSFFVLAFVLGERGQAQEMVAKNDEAVFGFEDKSIIRQAEPVFTAVVDEDEIKRQPEISAGEISENKLNLTEKDIEKLKDIEYLKKNFYIVDSRTGLTSNDIDAEKFLKMDFSLNAEAKGPKILIFHTHSSEMYADSDSKKNMEEGIWGVGERLKEVLETKYGIEVLHDNGRYDVVNGKGQITGAYERMEPAIRKILEENPSIEVMIDMHRDGVNDGVRLVTEENGKQCAKIMFFNGICRLNNNGALESIASLPNPYIEDNLAFSFNMQLMANRLYPDFTRRVYINAYRYSLNMLPKSLLIEVGAQTNTKQEAYNAMEPLAEILAQVLKAE